MKLGVKIIFCCNLHLFFARPNVISDLPFVTFIKIQHLFRSIDNGFVHNSSIKSTIFFLISAKISNLKVKYLTQVLLAIL